MPGQVWRFLHKTLHRMGDLGQILQLGLERWIRMESQLGHLEDRSLRKLRRPGGGRKRSEIYIKKMYKVLFVVGGK